MLLSTSRIWIPHILGHCFYLGHCYSWKVLRHFFFATLQNFQKIAISISVLLLHWLACFSVVVNNNNETSYCSYFFILPISCCRWPGSYLLGTKGLYHLHHRKTWVQTMWLGYFLWIQSLLVSSCWRWMCQDWRCSWFQLLLKYLNFELRTEDKILYL